MYNIFYTNIFVNLILWPFTLKGFVNLISERDGKINPKQGTGVSAQKRNYCNRGNGVKNIKDTMPVR